MCYRTRYCLSSIHVYVDRFSLAIICEELLDESYLLKDLPLFLPPAIFSKLDRPSKYLLDKSSACASE